MRSLKDSEGGIPLDLSREFEQRVKRLEAELEVAEDQRRKAAQEVVKLQSQLSESQHAAKGHKEVLVSEVSFVPHVIEERPNSRIAGRGSHIFILAFLVAVK